MVRPQIHVLLDDPEVPPTVAQALQRIGAGVRLSRLENELRSPTPVAPDARLVVASDRPDGFSQHWDALFEHFRAQPCATLVLSPTPAPPRRASAAGTEGTAPIGFASDLTVEDLAGRLTAMCAFRPSFQRMRQELEDLRRRDALGRLSTQREYAEQLRLASQLQRDLLPHSPPRLEGARLHTLHRPADHVSGDIYDLSRLDEEHVALSYADATGHGVPAALLTMLIRRTLRGKEVNNGGYRLLRPGEVLERLNRELLEAELSECLFVTGLYAAYHEPTRTLRWARGGAPYPVLVRPGEPAAQLRTDGPLLGAFQEASFECRMVTLQPGDAVLFHTDGLDSLLLHENGRRAYDHVAETPWFRRLGTQSIDEHLGELTSRLDHTPVALWPVDDVTVLALQVE